MPLYMPRRATFGVGSVSTMRGGGSNGLEGHTTGHTCYHHGVATRLTCIFVESSQFRPCFSIHLYVNRGWYKAWYKAWFDDLPKPMMTWDDGLATYCRLPRKL